MFSRLIHSTLKRMMTQFAVVTVTGPRQSGKTAEHRQLAISDYTQLVLTSLQPRQHFRLKLTRMRSSG